MTRNAWNYTHWGDRMHWRPLADITVLKPGYVIRAMGSKGMLIASELGDKSLLIAAAYHRLLEAKNDDVIECLTKVIQIASAEETEIIPPRYKRALEKVLHC
jgi:hypothetical protein